MNKIRVEDLHKSYKDGKINLQVLRGINLEVRQGEILCIIGPSGAGKSTLLHLIGGLDKPSKGKVFFDQHDLYALSDDQRAAIRNKRMGFVFQFYHLLSEFSALENVMLPAAIRGVSFSSAQKTAEELLKLVGLKARMIHKPSQLSGGEQQRVAIARTLINDPDMILCDEPTGNLDSERSQGIAQLLQQLSKQQGKTVVIVTHEEKFTKIADRIIHIKDGALINE